MAYVSLCKALYDYTAAAEDELTFSEDALLYVVDAEDAEWWKAKLKTSDDDNDEGPIGLIPANYVEEAEPIRASRALYDYAKQNDDELDIEEDEMLSVYEEKGEWLLVKRQQDNLPVGQLGFVPANYVDEVAAVDGVTEPMEAAPEPESHGAVPSTPSAAIPIAAAPAISQSSAPLKTAKNDEIKMWAASELDAKKKKKKGTLGIGNSSVFFASESDKAPVQKISVLSIIGHSIENKARQINLELDQEAVGKVQADETNHLRFVFSNKGEADDVWQKIEESQQKTHDANNEPDGDESAAAPSLPSANRPVVDSTPIPPPPPAPPAPSVAATFLPPPTRSAALAKPTSAASTPPAAPVPSSSHSKAQKGNEEKAIALYDFEAQGDDELTVVENEALVLVERETEDWWKVRNMKGREGVVPASYVEVADGPDASANAEVAEDDDSVAEATAGAAAMSVSKKANEKDANEAQAARDAARRAAEEEERQRQEEEEEEAAERERLQAERRARAEEQKRARAVEERRRQALKAQQPAPAPPRAPPTTATSSASASTAARDVSIPSGRSAPSRPKEASSKSKPSPARTRVWHDRTGQFRVEAEFLGFNQGKIRLHKLNGVVIEVAIEKMSHPDISYLEDVTGRKLAPARSSQRPDTNEGRDRDRERERRREQEREQRRRQESARGPKRNVDWFEFFLAAGVDIDDCTRYASAFERDKIDEGILPELDGETLRKIGLREGDIIRVTKFIAKRYSNKNAKISSNGTRSNPDQAAQIRADEAMARKLQEQEQAARRNGTTPPPNLFSGPDGTLKNNTRRGRPTNNAQRSTSAGVDAASLAAASESLARTTSPPMRSNTTSPEVARAPPTPVSASAAPASGFDDDAWTPRPSSTKPVTPAAAASPVPAAAVAATASAPTPPPQPPRPASTSTTPAPAAAASPAPVVEAPKAPEVKADPNSALFDKLAAMKPASPGIGQQQRPGASPLGTGSFNGPRGPFAPVAQNQSMLQPLIPTQGTGQFVPTSMGYQPTGMAPMQMQATGWGGMQQQQQPQMTGYMQHQQQQPTGFNNGFGGGGGGGAMQSPFGGIGMQPTGYAAGGGMMSPPMPGQQPQTPQYTSQQYGVQQQQQKQQEINNGPDRFTAANVFGQMKQGNMHQQQQDANASPQNAQKYDALRPQPTGFQPGGYLNAQFTGYGGAPGSYGGGGY